MLIADSQVHVWSAEPSTWIPVEGHGGIRSWGRRYGAGELLDAMGDAGVDRAVLIPPTWQSQTNEVALQLAREHPDTFTVVGRLAVWRDDIASQLATWKNEQMRGIRVMFTLESDLARLARGEIEPFWAAAERYDIPVMVYAPGSWDELEAIAARFPGLRLAIDHLGLPPGLPLTRSDGPIGRLISLSRFPNVSVKASGLPARATDPFPFASMRETVYRVVDAFGASRVFWGSDLTTLSGPYDETVRAFTEGLPRLGEHELELVMGTALLSWLDWR